MTKPTSPNKAPATPGAKRAKPPAATTERNPEADGGELWQMFARVWHSCEPLADMMEKCRTRLFARNRKGEGNHYANELLDQSARSLADQLAAIATFARHVSLWENPSFPSPETMDYAKIPGFAEAAKEAAKKGDA